MVANSGENADYSSHYLVVGGSKAEKKYIHQRGVLRIIATTMTQKFDKEAWIGQSMIFINEPSPLPYRTELPLKEFYYADLLCKKLKCSNLKKSLPFNFVQKLQLLSLFKCTSSSFHEPTGVIRICTL